MENISEKVMDIIDCELHDEVICARKCEWLRKRTFNPIRKLQLYFDQKRFMNHVFGIELVRNKLETILTEEEP